MFKEILLRASSTENDLDIKIINDGFLVSKMYISVLKILFKRELNVRNLSWELYRIKFTTS